MGIKRLVKETQTTFGTEGAKGVVRKTKNYIKSGRYKGRQINMDQLNAHNVFMDVLFVNGCALAHPARYRVSHQKEQLLAGNILSDEIYFEDITMELAEKLAKRYRVIIIFRCPYREPVGRLIEVAKSLNKTVLYDIDDLVIDTKYTDTIKFLDTMSEQERKGYDEGVNLMQKTMRLCDGAITTTERLATELSNYVPEVFINRNTSSDRMVELSETVVYNRDVLPLLDENKVPTELKETYKKYIEHAKTRKQGGVRLGYFSGSITHNDDVILILPVLSRLMQEYPTLELHIVGELDVPVELERFKDRIITRPFVDWNGLPELIASVDINLGPLEESIFNEAKSENKWVEAALVKVPTVASRIGAFEKMMQDGETGYLCSTAEEWYEKLKKLIESEELRHQISETAYTYVHKHCIAINTFRGITEYIRSKMKPNIAFVVPSTNISGGILVTFKHCEILMKQGVDVLLISEDYNEKNIKWRDIEIPVVSMHMNQFRGSFDRIAATFWHTVDFVQNYPRAVKKYYLVQNFETRFYKPGDINRFIANGTYSADFDLKYVTISKWCQQWLKDDYGQDSAYVPNGIDAKQFYPIERAYDNRKIRILIEGDSGSYYKNTDESFRVVDRLDKDKYEIWYMSYEGAPKKGYYCDKFLQRVPYEKVGDVYRQCDILLKSSILESFSYPPVEMMATGGYCVVVLNDGNAEYVKDGENCLVYEQGNIEQAVEQIKRIANDIELRNRLYQGGQEVVKQREWMRIKDQIVSLYDFK